MNAGDRDWLTLPQAECRNPSHAPEPQSPRRTRGTEPEPRSLRNAKYLTLQQLNPRVCGERGGADVSNPRSNNTVAIDSHALGTLNYIRASIEAAGAFAVPGIAGIAMGVVGVVATLVASISGLAAYWLEVWLIAALAAAASGVLFVARHSRQPAAGMLYRGPARKFVLSLCPSLLAGAVLTVVLWNEGLSSLIPGAWLVLYGCAVLSASMMTNAAMLRLVATMGGLFVVFGMAAFMMAPRWHNLLLGAGFGALHLVFGILIGRTERVD